MKAEKVAFLKELKRTFDIFLDSPSPPADLVKNNLVPPLPIRGKELVWGYAILRKAEEMGCSELYTMPMEISKGEALYLALSLEGRSDKYSWREKAAIHSVMRSEDDPVEETTELLSLVQSEGSFIPLAERFIAFPDHIRLLVEKGVIDIKTAEAVEFLDPAVVSRLEGLCEKASFSQRRQLFTWMYEIIRRDGLSPDETAAMLDHMSRESVIGAVQKVRFPTLTSLEEAVDNFRNRYVRGSGIDLKPPPQFEGENYVIRFEWKTGKQMERIIEDLRTMNEHRDELFRLLF